MESKEQMSSWPRTYIMPTKHLPYVSEAGHRLCQGDLEIEQSAPALGHHAASGTLLPGCYHEPFGPRA